MTIKIFYSIIIMKKCVRRLFYRYISENFTNYVNQGELEAGNISFDYIKLLDEKVEQAREDLIQSKGYFILPSELFL